MLNTSSADFYRLLDGSCVEVPPTAFFAFSDVRDVAYAHLAALESPQAAGQRYIVANGPFTYHDIVAIIHRLVPEVREATPISNTGEAPLAYYQVSNEKATRELKMAFRSLEETVLDTTYSLLGLQRQIHGDPKDMNDAGP